MDNLYDLGLEVTRIREAINSLETKGRENAALIVYAYDKCNDIIQAINRASRSAEACQNGQVSEEAEEHGEQNTGAA